MVLVCRPVFKTGSRWITPTVAGSIPALSAKKNKMKLYYKHLL